jgi:hypothetical protein
MARPAVAAPPRCPPGSGRVASSTSLPARRWPRRFVRPAAAVVAIADAVGLSIYRTVSTDFQKNPQILKIKFKPVLPIFAVFHETQAGPVWTVLNVHEKIELQGRICRHHVQSGCHMPLRVCRRLDRRPRCTSTPLAVYVGVADHLRDRDRYVLANGRAQLLVTVALRARRR